MNSTGPLRPGDPGAPAAGGGGTGTLRGRPSLAPIATAGSSDASGAQTNAGGPPVRDTFSRRGASSVLSPGPVSHGPMTPHASLTESRGPPQMPPQHSQQPRSHSPVPPQQPRADSMRGSVELRPLRKYQAPPGERPFQFRVGRPLPSLPPRDDGSGGAPRVELEHPGLDSVPGRDSGAGPGMGPGMGPGEAPHPNAVPDGDELLDGEDYVPMGKHIVSASEFENRAPSAMQENVFYVENPRTGDFARVPRSELGAASKVAAGPAQLDDENVRATTFKTFMDTLAGVVATFFLLSQGALGGFSLLQLLFTVRYPPNVEFLRYYSPLAADAQRVYFVLTTLSLLAAIDKYAKDKMSGWNGSEVRQQITDVLIIACYFVAFLFSLLNANTDDLLTYSEARVPGWYETRGIPSSFHATLARWHAFNIIRIIGSIIGWLLVSTETRNYGINESNYKLLLRQRQNAALQ